MGDDDAAQQARIERLETRLGHVRAERDALARRVATLEATLEHASAILEGAADDDAGHSRAVVPADEDEPPAGAIQVVGDVDRRAED